MDFVPIVHYIFTYDPPDTDVKLSSHQKYFSSTQDENQAVIHKFTYRAQQAGK